ncbi:MAG TPA: hypothetical protein DCW93_08330 [Saprospirales bacterium]|nr:hypothetical protein [Saprospirales bacterium]
MSINRSMKKLIIAFFLLQINILQADDNIISVEQSGDNLALGIDQIGYNNQILMKDDNSYITSSSLSMYLVQHNDSNSINKIIFDEVSGSGNQMKLAQGVAWNTLDSETDLSWWADGYEGGGHEIDITLYGDDNDMAVQQTNQGSTTGHSFDLHLAGDGNKVQVKQQSDGAKNLTLTIYNDYNDVFVRQKGNNTSHTATITLDGLYGTDLTLRQMSTTSQTYNLSQTCMTVGGCAVNVLQE